MRLTTAATVRIRIEGPDESGESALPDPILNAITASDNRAAVYPSISGHGVGDWKDRSGQRAREALDTYEVVWPTQRPLEG